MGSFIGHAIPGSFFFIYGLWWVTQIFRRHFLCRQRKQPYYATLTFPFPYSSERRIREFPVEPVLKIVFSGMGIIVEIIGGINKESHRFDSVGNTQHITMYFFFGLSGVIDILVLKDLAPKGCDYAATSIALLIEGALFKFHVFGRDELDVLLHTLLVYVIGFSALVIALEAAFRNNTLLPLLRGLLFMLQGSWFWGVGFILYNPFPGAKPWDPEDHHTLMLAVVCFSWHVAVHVILLIAIGGFTRCCYRNDDRARYSQLNNAVALEALEGVGGEEEEEGLLSGEGGGGKEGRRNGSGNGPVVLDEELSDLEFESPVVRNGKM